MMKTFKTYGPLMLAAMMGLSLTACHDDDNGGTTAGGISTNGEDDYKYVGKATNGFTPS